MACRSAVTGDEGTICAAFDGTRTHFFGVDPAAQVNALASVVGRVYLHGDTEQGWIVGWWDRQLTLFRPATRQAIRVPAADGNRVGHLAVGDTMVAAVSSNGGGSVVRVYALADCK
jgi:hypothetical protein